MTFLRPLKPFVSTSDGPLRVDDLRALSNGTPEAMRDDIARYLRSCPMFLAWMEYTTDVIGDRFGVSGGSAVMSDGTYYWRLDAANYVETYGTALPDDFISHGNRQRWTPPDLSEAQYDVVYAELESMIPASSDGFITFRPTE